MDTEQSMIPGNHLPKGRRRKKREPDLIWDTVVAIWYPAGVPKFLCSKVNAEVQAFKSLGATERSIRQARENYMGSIKMKGVLCTARGLLAQWGQFRPGGTEAPAPKARTGMDDAAKYSRDTQRDMERNKQELAMAKRYVESLAAGELEAAWASLLRNAKPYLLGYLKDKHPLTHPHAAWEIWVTAGRRVNE